MIVRMSRTIIFILVDRNLKLKKSKQLSMPDKEILKLLVEFIDFAVRELKLGDTPIVITLLHAAPDKPITTGAFDPNDGSICVIVENRHFIDFTRTIAHELTHLSQSENGELAGDIPEIGGKIEDDANIWSGKITKKYLKTILTPEKKKFLGLGTF